MTSLTIAQSNFQIQSSITVYEYQVTLINPQDDNIQQGTAAFTSVPALQDWKQWLLGWVDTGYQLQSEPVFVRTI